MTNEELKSRLTTPGTKNNLQYLTQLRLYFEENAGFTDEELAIFRLRTATAKGETKMAEYIRRSYIRKMAMFEMAYTMETETDATVVLSMIEDAPAADVVPVKHGVWEKTNMDGFLRCSACRDCYIDDV